jgi:hypothetical protein
VYSSSLGVSYGAGMKRLRYLHTGIVLVLESHTVPVSHAYPVGHGGQWREYGREERRLGVAEMQ